MDSAAALAFVQIEKEAATQNIPCRLVNLNDESKGIFSVIHEDALIHPPFKSDNITTMALSVRWDKPRSDIARDFVNFVTFIGELLVALLYTLRHPKSTPGKGRSFLRPAGRCGWPAHCRPDRRF
ncbi:MAG: STAS domain-containing protein [Desulfobacterales bacterium]|nr:STAS domain-containing protein [Desulfobacterales bacterium]